LLFLDGVEVVDHAADLFSEVVDSAADLVPAGQGRALFGEAGSFRLEFVVAGGDVSGPSQQLGQLNQPGLVEVDQSTHSASGGFDLRSNRASSAASSPSSRTRAEGEGVFPG
jgi:hypothetical protein